MWTLGFLLLLAKNMLAFSNFEGGDANYASLYRKRRFLTPEIANDWTFTGGFFQEN